MDDDLGCGHRVRNAFAGSHIAADRRRAGRNPGVASA
jgi:hypothetical protein